MRFECYLPEQAERLSSRLGMPEWRRLIRSGMVEEARGKRLITPEDPPADRPASEHLIARNEAAVRAQIGAGERDREALLAALVNWTRSDSGRVLPGLSFLGLCLTWACDTRPRCLYCNQQPTSRRMRLADWKRVISEASESGCRPYVYLTGGEPLLWGGRLYGPQGLVRHATALGCSVNVNTNALRLTPVAALRLVENGLAKLHISLDSADPAVHDRIAGEQGRWQRIIDGIENILIARELLGSDRPVVHLNCVLTRENARSFPQLIRLALAMKKQRSEGYVGGWRNDPAFRDLGVHLIPVGGVENASLRLSSEEVRRFYKETWAQAAGVWERYQDACGIEAENRVAFNDWAFFASAWLRVRHRGSLDDYAEASAAGEYARLALGSRCHIAPTQAFILPDGSQYWCGAHSISRPEPVGNVLEATVMTNIQRSLAKLSNLPGPYCRNCATATLFLNQVIEETLMQKMDSWLAEQEDGPKPST